MHRQPAPPNSAHSKLGQIGAGHTTRAPRALCAALARAVVRLGTGDDEADAARGKKGENEGFSFPKMWKFQKIQGVQVDFRNFLRNLRIVINCLTIRWPLMARLFMHPR